MTNLDLVALAQFVLFSLICLVAYASRQWIVAKIQKQVQHDFDKKIEHLKAQLRESEEGFKSSLRDRENEIALLRNTVLNGSANRQSLLDKRRFDAVERVWDAAIKLGKLKPLSAQMAVLNIDQISKQNSDPKIQAVLAVLDKLAPDVDEFSHAGFNEKLFLPDEAWAYFSAYQTILISNYLVFKTLRTGIKDPMDYINRGANNSVLKAALPEQSSWIDAVKPEQYYYLLDQLLEKLLTQLKAILNGVAADQAATERAKLIISEIGKAESASSIQPIKDIVSGAKELGITAASSQG